MVEALTAPSAPRPGASGWAALLALTVLAVAASPARAAESAQAAATSRLFDRIAGDPPRLQAFVRAMPKGGDLHNHLSGAIYAESYLGWAAAGGLCLDVATHAIARPPCTGGLRPAAAALAQTPGLRDAMIDSLSMRDFLPTPSDASGHDHFFSTFGRFDVAETGHVGDMLAEEASRAAAEHTQYLEIMWYPRLREAAALGLSRPWSGEDFAADLAAVQGGLPALLAEARQDTDQAEARMRQVLRCGGPDADPGCGVAIRYQAFLLRTLPPAAVFAQLAYGYALVRADPRFVGVNIVAPEDDPVALRDYGLHMRAFRFFHAAHPDVHLSLHAGELALGLVPPEALRDHIRQAVEMAGASRIGHGVDIADEDDPAGLLAEMARRHVAVEINQTSNAEILGVAAPAHPFPFYRAAGVPLVLSTDDEGVSRIDLSHEYLRAVRSWHLRYPDLKALARTAIAASFLAGAPLPTDALGAPRDDPALVARSDRARLQWQLELAFRAFEARNASAG